MGKTLEAWIELHPFLEPIARMEATVQRCVRSLPEPRIEEMDFEKYRPDFEAGAPLLRSPDLGGRLMSVASGSFEALGPALAEAQIPEPLASKVLELYDHIQKTGAPYELILSAIATDSQDAPSLPHLGAARYIVWKALAHALSPAIAKFTAWREHEVWPHGYCPTCGAPPLLSLLAKKEEARQRSLICGLCSTRWNVRRLGCPHCGTEDENQLGILEIDYEPELRLEVCNLCKGYLKTWAGEEQEAPFFSDWATVHLDAMAADRGYLRLGASLYEI